MVRCETHSRLLQHESAQKKHPEVNRDVSGTACRLKVFVPLSTGDRETADRRFDRT